VTGRTSRLGKSPSKISTSKTQRNIKYLSLIRVF
jgi:hypothetical protein